MISMGLLSPVNAGAATAGRHYRTVLTIEKRDVAKNFYRVGFRGSPRGRSPLKTLVRQVFYRTVTRSVQIWRSVAGKATTCPCHPSEPLAGQPVTTAPMPCAMRVWAVCARVYPQCCPPLVHRPTTTYSSRGGEKGCLTTVSSGVEFAARTLSPARHGVYRFRFIAASFSRRGRFQEA